MLNFYMMHEIILGKFQSLKIKNNNYYNILFSKYLKKYNNKNRFIIIK